MTCSKCLPTIRGWRSILRKIKRNYELRINGRKPFRGFSFFLFLNYAVMGGVLTLLLRGRGQRRQPRWDSQQMEANGFRRRLNVTCAWGNSNAIAIALHTHTYMHVRLAGILSTSKIDYMPISTSSTYMMPKQH